MNPGIREIKIRYTIFILPFLLLSEFWSFFPVEELTAWRNFLSCSWSLLWIEKPTKKDPSRNLTWLNKISTNGRSTSGWKTLEALTIFRSWRTWIFALVDEYLTYCMINKKLPIFKLDVGTIYRDFYQPSYTVYVDFKPFPFEILFVNRNGIVRWNFTVPRSTFETTKSVFFSNIFHSTKIEFHSMILQLGTAYVFSDMTMSFGFKFCWLVNLWVERPFYFFLILSIARVLSWFVYYWYEE